MHWPKIALFSDYFKVRQVLSTILDWFHNHSVNKLIFIMKRHQKKKKKEDRSPFFVVEFYF